MIIELREITMQNYENVIDLKLSENQASFVSKNVHFLAQAWVFKNTAFPFAIYANNALVGFIGFIILGFYEVKNQYTLWIFMIDKPYQNKGYGKQALQLGIDYLVNNFNVNEIYTAYAHDNIVAGDLYRTFVFI